MSHRSFSRPLLVSVALSLAVGSFAAPNALAQGASTAEKAAAETLFKDGVTQMKQGNFPVAIKKLKESQRLDPAVGTLLYLAESYEKLGKFASAWATFKEASSMARKRGDARRQATADTRAGLLESKLSKIVINVPAAARVEGLKVTNGLVPVRPATFGGALPVDPGTVEVSASAPGKLSWRTQVTVSSSSSVIKVDVPVLKDDPNAGKVAAPPPVSSAPPPAKTAEPSPPPPPKTEEDPGSGQRTLGLVLGGVGLVGMGVGAIFGFQAISKNDDAKGFCPKGNLCNDPQGVSLTDDAKGAATVSNLAFALGGAALLGGILLYSTAPSEESPADAKLMLAPSVGRSSAGLQLGGVFQ